MDEEKDFSFGAIFLQTVQTVAVVFQILGHFTSFDIEDVYENSYVLEYGGSLGGEV